MPCVVAIDAGTTGVRSRAIFPGDPAATVSSYREFTQHYPQPGWVEHDASEIWTAICATLVEVVERVGAAAVAAIGITNQRETVVAWRRSTGEPYGNAIVWQDRRTAARCDALAAAGALDSVRRITGLVLDPYFSGTKIEWLLANREIDRDDLAIGTTRQLADLEVRPAARSTRDRPRRTPAGRCCSTSADRLELVDRSAMCSMLGVPLDASAGGVPVEWSTSGRRLARPACPSAGGTSVAAGAQPASPSPASPATSRPHCCGQACWHGGDGRTRTPTAPARSCCSTSGRRPVRRPRRAAHARRAGRSATGRRRRGGLDLRRDRTSVAAVAIMTTLDVVRVPATDLFRSSSRARDAHGRRQRIVSNNRYSDAPRDPRRVRRADHRPLGGGRRHLAR